MNESSSANLDDAATRRGRLIASLIEKGSAEKDPAAWIRSLTLRALRVLDIGKESAAEKSVARREIHEIAREVSQALKAGAGGKMTNDVTVETQSAKESAGQDALLPDASLVRAPSRPAGTG